MKLFCCFSNLCENSLNVQCIHDISHLLRIYDENKKYKKIIWSQHRRRLISLSEAPGSFTVSKGYCVQTVIGIYEK